MRKELARFFLSVPSFLFIAFGFNYLNHKAYYSTIYSVQTVDFNILANTLPTKLSLALKQGNLKEIQHTINSNYGLFGIILTDCKEEAEFCPNQKVLAKSQPERQGWGEKKFPENLAGNPYDILRYPLPIAAEWKFKDARALEIISTRITNKGEILGRVYYVRRDPPAFLQSQTNWLSKPLESVHILLTSRDTEKAGNKLSDFFNSGANKYYLLTNLLGLAVGLSIWRIWERISYQKELQKRIYEQKEKDISLKIDRYERQSLVLQAKVEDLEVSLLKKKKDADYLQLELQKAKELVEEEERKIHELQNKFIHTTEEARIAKQENTALIERLRFARQDANEKWQMVSSLQIQLDSIQQTELEINKIKEQLKRAINAASTSQSNIEKLSKELEESSEILAEKEANFSELSNQFSVSQEILQAKEENIVDLKKSLTEILAREKQYLDLIDSLKQEKMELESTKEELEIYRTVDIGQSILRRDQILGKELDDLCDSIGKENEELKNCNQDLKRENTNLIKEREFLKDRLIELEKFESGESDCDDEDFSFPSVFEALKAAERECSFLEIWDSAIESVYTVNYYLPNKVYKYLLILNNVGEKFFNKTVGTDLDDFFRSQGVVYAPRESPSTLSLYGNDRKFWHRGQAKQQMIRHLKVGRRLRIYFEFDEKYKKVQIGYCGKHLQTSRG